MKFHYKPQYTLAQTGWTHGCQANNTKAHYINDKFENKQCNDGNLKSSNHPNCDIFGFKKR